MPHLDAAGATSTPKPSFWLSQRCCCAAAALRRSPYSSASARGCSGRPVWNCAPTETRASPARRRTSRWPARGTPPRCGSGTGPSSRSGPGARRPSGERSTRRSGSERGDDSEGRSLGSQPLRATPEGGVAQTSETLLEAEPSYAPTPEGGLADRRVAGASSIDAWGTVRQTGGSGAGGKGSEASYGGPVGLP